MSTRYFDRNRVFQSTVISGLWVILAAPIGAQETPPADVASRPATADAEVAQPFSTTDISSRADEVATTLLEMQKMLESDESETADIPILIDALQADLKSRLRPLSTINVVDMNQSDVESLLQTVRRMARQLEAWRDRLQQQADLLDKNSYAINTQLVFFRSIVTMENIDGMPDALIERVNSVILNLETGKQAIRERLDHVLAELTRISSIKLQINEATQIVESGQEQLKRDILTFDRPPIWRAAATAESSAERLPRELRSRFNGVAEFALANEAAVIVTLVSLFLVLGSILYARPSIIRRAGESAEDRNLQPFIDRPISLAILLWAVVGPQVLLPPLPVALDVLRALVIAVTLWRLLSLISFNAGQNSIRGLLALFVLASLMGLYPPGDLTDRVLLLLISAAAMYLFIGFKRSLKALAKQKRNLWWRLSLIIASVAPFILFISIAGLLLGAVAFAEHLIVALLRITVVVVATVVIEEALKGLAYLFVSGWGQRWLRSIRRFPTLAQRRLDGLIRLTMFLIFLSILPRVSSLMAMLYEKLYEIFTTDYTIGTVELSLVDISALAFSVVLAIYVAKFVRFTLDEDIFPRLPIAAGASAAASRLIYYALVLGGIIFALAAGGVELSRLTLVMSALGIGIGFGLQNIVNNFVSGLVLAFEQPFQVGDIIETGTLTGRVRLIGLRASRVQTLDGAEVIVPNADLIAGNVINWTLSDRMRRIDVDVGVAYGSDPGNVRLILMQVAEKSDSVISSPEPAALFIGFGDSSLDFTLRVWIHEAGNWPQITSDLNEAVYAALDEADIEIPYPQRTLHIRSDERSD